MFTVAKHIYKGLLRHNVKNVWLYSGGSIMPLVDQFHKGKINYYVNTHEQNCGHAATGYAKSSGRTGVVAVTSGPGLTNMVTPMLDAQNDSTPLVVFSGQVPVSAMGTNAFQECPAVDITRSVTKWSYCLKDPEEVSSVIDEAFTIANHGKKGVVHIDLPKSVLNTKVVSSRTNIDKIADQRTNTNNKHRYIIQINNAERPVIIVGQGATHCSELLTKLAEVSNIPVTSTLHGVGVIDEAHPLSLKFLGMHGSATANYAVQESDCIIAIGYRFDDRTIGTVQKYAPNAKIILNNISNNEIKRVVKVLDRKKEFVQVQEDSKTFITKLLGVVKYRPRTEWFAKINHWKQSYPFVYETPVGGRLKAQDVVRAINQYMDKDNTIVTTGVGNHQMFAAQFIDWKHPRRLLTSGSLGVMGVGLPYAIGAQVANPNMTVLDIDGDGSFNHTLSDLKTIATYKLPIKIAILDDASLSMVRVWEELFFEGRHVATDNTDNPDYAYLAKSFGIASISCNRVSSLDYCVQRLLSYKGPMLCHFKVDTDKCLPLVKPGCALDDMLLHSDQCDRLTGEAPA